MDSDLSLYTRLPAHPGTVDARLLHQHLKALARIFFSVFLLSCFVALILNHGPPNNFSRDNQLPKSPSPPPSRGVSQGCRRRHSGNIPVWIQSTIGQMLCWLGKEQLSIFSPKRIG
ncbi:glycosyl hydrolases family 32 protein [Actinidia rufa]|uniref:Glycosyl hydrolases family 32 protein n=1 Tax=Actinidia rufa TaxID=165716 RepID=A0A7J0EF93_9ERIC|nr:glycosyl hydrolases family 32 protein [Actinidia rufa]